MKVHLAEMRYGPEIAKKSCYCGLYAKNLTFDLLKVDCKKCLAKWDKQSEETQRELANKAARLRDLGM